MPQTEFDLETSLPPERVVAMFTDFSERRPEIWPGLWEGAYEVYSVGDTSAEIREGNKTPRIWSRERYDWSRPGVVRWEVVDSNFNAPGGFLEVHVSPRDGGGSRLHVHWSRTATTFSARFVVALIKLTRGAPVKRQMAAGLSRAERAAESGG